MSKDTCITKVVRSMWGNYEEKECGISLKDIPRNPATEKLFKAAIATHKSFPEIISREDIDQYLQEALKGPPIYFRIAYPLVKGYLIDLFQKDARAIVEKYRKKTTPNEPKEQRSRAVEEGQTQKNIRRLGGSRFDPCVDTGGIFLQNRIANSGCERIRAETPACSGCGCK